MLRNLIVKTHFESDVTQWQLRGSLVISVSGKTQLAQLIKSSLQQPLEHITVVAVFLYVLLLVYLSLPLIFIPQKPAYYLTFPLDT